MARVIFEKTGDDVDAISGISMIQQMPYQPVRSVQRTSDNANRHKRNA